VIRRFARLYAIARSLSSESRQASARTDGARDDTLRAAMAFERKYAPPQREAIELAWGDAGIRPAARICELARSGALRDRHGESCAAFAVPESAVRSIGARYLRRRRARARELAPPAVDRLEALRGRMLDALEDELERVERSLESRRNSGRPPRIPAADQIRALARAARELAALQAPTSAGERPPAAVSQRGLAAAIVRANASGAPPAMAPVGELQTSSERLEDPTGARSPRERIYDGASAGDLEAPGTRADASARELSATSVRVR